MVFYVFFIFALCGVYSASASYCYYTSFYYTSYLYYCPYYYYVSAGTIAGAVVGSIVGVAIIVVIILVLCGAFTTKNRRGVVVQPMQTTATVVATNNSNIQYPQNYNQNNQYPPPGGAAYPPPQNMTYPPPVEAPASAFYNQPPPVYTGTKN